MAMIVLDLCCDAQHLFEGWFASGEDFGAQAGAGRVECPLCGSVSVTRRPSAPYVQRAGQGQPSTEHAVAKKPEAALQAAALKLARGLMAGAENVGERFAEEARRIHYGEAEQRTIRGIATRQQTGELLDEGIPVLPVPLPGDDSLH